MWRSKDLRYHFLYLVAETFRFPFFLFISKREHKGEVVLAILPLTNSLEITIFFPKARFTEKGFNREVTRESKLL